MIRERLAERDRERVEARLAELRDLRDRLAQVRAEIRVASPRLAELEDPRPVDLASVTRELEPGTLLLAFSVGADRTDLFALAAGGELSVERLPIGSEELRREIETLRELIRATSTPSPRLEGLRAVSRRLFERLLAPVEARIERDRGWRCSATTAPSPTTARCRRSRSRRRRSPVRR